MKVRSFLSHLILVGGLLLATTSSATEKSEIERQRELFREKAREVIGDSSLTAFSDPAAVDAVIRKFLIRNATTFTPTSSRGAGALALLQGGVGSAGLGNLLLARTFQTTGY